jgi:hypothetical protein
MSSHGDQPYLRESSLDRLYTVYYNPQIHPKQQSEHVRPRSPGVWNLACGELRG